MDIDIGDVCCTSANTSLYISSIKSEQSINHLVENIKRMFMIKM